MEIPKPAEADKQFFVSLPELAASWVHRACTHVSTLPPKVKKPQKSGK